MVSEEDDWQDIVTADMLRRCVTLDEYFAEKLAEVGEERYQSYLAADEQDRAQLEPRAQPQDEWWEWVMGTQPLMQMGGLALVRSGNIIWSCGDWIS